MKRAAFSIFAGALLAVISAGPLFSAIEGPTFRRIGLYVGSNSGGKDRITLAYASTDAKSMAE
ncbi:MAG TPA: hypothetical protein VMW69_02275, partial [Spirochaetia bacterium]|nr:hypothetical protein [Spirochaetia bacterium]